MRSTSLMRIITPSRGMRARLPHAPQPSSDCPWRDSPPCPSRQALRRPWCGPSRPMVARASNPAQAFPWASPAEDVSDTTAVACSLGVAGCAGLAVRVANVDFVGSPCAPEPWGAC